MNKLKVGDIAILLILLVVSTVSVGGFYILNEELMQVKQEKQQLENDLITVENNLITVENDLKDVEDDLKDTENNLIATENSLNENLSELQKLQSGNRYETHDPTYWEVVNFISVDKTDQIPYEDKIFDCSSFAQVVNNNAEDKGIRCAYIVLEFSQTAHTLIGFNTTDRGMVYIEPQHDHWVENLEVGRDYFTECIIPDSGYYYAEDPDDTIEKILIYW